MFSLFIFSLRVYASLRQLLYLAVRRTLESKYFNICIFSHHIPHIRQQWQSRNAHHVRLLYMRRSKFPDITRTNRSPGRQHVQRSRKTVVSSQMPRSFFMVVFCLEDPKRICTGGLTLGHSVAIFRGVPEISREYAATFHTS